MKLLFWSFVYLLPLYYCHAQGLNNVNKPVIDSTAIINWADLQGSDAIISNNGHYFMYCIGNKPVNTATLVIQATEGIWKKEIIGVRDGFFSEDSKLAIFEKGDTLYFQKLDKKGSFYETGVCDLKHPKNAKGNLLAYRLRNNNELVLMNLITNSKQKYKNVIDYTLNNDGHILVIKTKDIDNKESLRWIDLTRRIERIIWVNAEYNNKELTTSGYCFDEESRQFIFITQDKKAGDTTRSIWYYNIDMDKAVMKVTNHSPGVELNLMISNGGLSFNKNGKYIFFMLEPVPRTLPKSNPDAVQVDVWNYKDLVLQHAQLAELQKTGKSSIGIGISNNQFRSFIAVNGNNAIRLTGNEETIEDNFKSDSEVLIQQRKYVGDKNWEEGQVSWYLASLNNGNRKLISNKWALLTVSPSSKTLLFFNSEDKAIYSYEIKSGNIICISNNIPERIFDEKMDEKTNDNQRLVGIAGWLGDSAIMIHDNYDIWRINFSRIHSPVNLTNGYGKKHGIKLRLINYKNSGSGDFYPLNQPLLLSAFCPANMHTGFFRFWLGQIGDPELLTMEPCYYYTQDQTYNMVGSMIPLKATRSNAWIVKRQSSSDAPNYYYSKDLKSYKQLTNFQPQKEYNWLTNELVEWKLPNGKSCQGILYKPENFDSFKKYPVIIHFYEKVSDNLYHFPQPEFTRGGINIPWFVSRGYIVFTPDIHYDLGDIGESIINSVVSGAKHIFNRTYIDSTKVGIQGHSFGGYETNMLITHTDIFSAAAEGAGPTDLISLFGSPLAQGGASGAVSPHNEKGGQFRLECLLSENPSVYIKNSPIFKVNKVTTPLLIVHNINDKAVAWQQAVEFFVALRRLNKPVWMLQYDKGGHSVYGTKAQMDLTIRLTQYFDHYLKGAPAPIWMTVGVPAELKGIDTGF